MYSFLKKCVFFLIVAMPLFSQNSERAQGLVTSDPFWRQALGGAVLSLPHVQVQSAVVALDGGNIRAYSTAGTPMWNYSARGKISPFVTRSREGTSYFSRLNGTLIAVNRAGRELWRRDLIEPLCAKVITGWDGRLFVPTDKKIACYTASGNLLWSRVFESPFSIAPKLEHGGGIMLALENNEVYRIDAFGNAQVWTLYNTPAILLSIERQQIMVLYTDGAIDILGSPEEWYISAKAQVQLSRFPKLPASPAAAASRGNNIAVALNDGRTVLLSIEKREILWTADSHVREMINSGRKPEPETEMLFDERGIYVLSKNGATSFSHDGTRLWFTFVQNAAAVPAFGDDGVLYSGGKDWILYAYRIEDRVLPTRNAVYGPLPEGSYGTGQPHSIYVEDLIFGESELKGKLDQIAAAINSGKVANHELAWTTFLLMLAAENDSIIYRIAALDLLGKIGSQETIPWLVNIFRKEQEPAIRAAAVKAIGEIGVDPQGIAIETFLFTVINGMRNDIILTAIASATGDLCRFSGPPLSETGARILNLLAARNQPSMVRRRANSELSSLR